MPCDPKVPIAGGAEMFNVELSNALSCRMIGPQHEYRFRYDRHGGKFDLTRTAVAEPHHPNLAKSGRPPGCPHR